LLKLLIVILSGQALQLASRFFGFVGEFSL
jgi:hypothetical protein